MYLKAITDRTTKEKITKSNVKTAMIMFKSNAQDLSWSELVHQVANDDTNTNFSRIFKNHNKIIVADL